MFIVKNTKTGKLVVRQDEAFYEEFKDKIDPTYFQGAYNKHILKTPEGTLDIISE